MSDWELRVKFVAVAADGLIAYGVYDSDGGVIDHLKPVGVVEQVTDMADRMVAALRKRLPGKAGCP